MDYLIIGGGGKVAAINPDSGNIKWETVLKSRMKLSGDVSLLIQTDILYAACQGYLFCIDRHNGNIKWNNELKGFGMGNLVMAYKGIISGLRHHTSHTGGM